MLKMFATQLHGLFNTINEKQVDAIEDSARLLAQALISDGKIYVYGLGEMEAIMTECVNSVEPLNSAVPIYSINEIDLLSNIDRVIVATRHSNDQEAMLIAKKLNSKQIPFVSISSHIETTEETINELADVSINIPIKKGLLPSEDGGRFAYPFSLAALYIYYGIKFTIDEILLDY